MKTKKRVLNFALILVFTSYFSAFSAEKKESVETDFVVEMDCQSCANKIKECLAFEKGVQDLKFDIENNLVSVKYDAKKCNSDKIIAALNKIGYEAEVIVKDVTLPSELNSKCGGCSHTGCGTKNGNTGSKESSCSGDHK